MVSLWYPIVDVARRRYWTLASLVCLIVAVASQTCLSLTGLMLGFNVSRPNDVTPIGFQRLFSQLITFMTLVVVAGNAAIFAAMSLSQSVRRRIDIAVMKAIGAAREVNSFFIAETLVTSAAGVLVGIVLGVVVYMVLGLVTGPVLGPWFGPDPLSLLNFTIVSILLAFFSAYIPLWWVVTRINTAAALSGQISGLNQALQAMGRRLNPTIRFALRDVLARRSETMVALVLTILSVSSLSILLLGGHTVLRTTHEYTQRGIGENVFLVAQPEMAQAYVGHLSFQDASRSRALPSSEIPSMFLSWLREQEDLTVDTRLVVEATALEMAFVEALPGPSYRIVGDERSMDVLVVGLQPNQVVSDWVASGRVLSQGDYAQSVIGDAVLDMFSDWSLERLILWGKSFSVVGTVVDPLNLGKTVYIPYVNLRTILGVDWFNVVLVKAKGSLEGISDLLESEAANFGLRVVALDRVIDSNTVSLDKLWVSMSVITSLGFLATTIGLASYLVASVQTRQDDFRVMLAIGSRWKRIVWTVLAESMILVLPSSVLGVLLGSLFSFSFLILSPAIPQTYTLATDVVTIAVASGLLCFVSAVAASMCLKVELRGP